MVHSKTSRQGCSYSSLMEDLPSIQKALGSDPSTINLSSISLTRSCVYSGFTSLELALWQDQLARPTELSFLQTMDCRHGDAALVISSDAHAPFISNASLLIDIPYISPFLELWKTWAFYFSFIDIENKMLCFIQLQSTVVIRLGLCHGNLGAQHSLLENTLPFLEYRFLYHLSEILQGTMIHG